jgi:hypothetical protein
MAKAIKTILKKRLALKYMEAYGWNATAKVFLVQALWIY